MSIILAACGGNSSGGSGNAPPITLPTAPPPSSSSGGSSGGTTTPLSPTTLDTAVATAFPSDMRDVTQVGANTDARGLLNQNRQWGDMFSPRFQLGAGQSVRIALAQNDIPKARAAFSGIRAGALVIAADGYVPSRLPESQFPGVVLSAGDVASGAAFFLSDACTAMIALQADSRRDSVALPAESNDTITALIRGTRWLQTQEALLASYDRNAPNRLLFDALAFEACGRLANDQSLMTSAERFVAVALPFARQDGVFLEDGGSDTNYQAVSVRLASDLASVGYSGGNSSALNTARRAGAIWLASRIRSDGTLDSAANTRTCGGGETFLGEVKRVSLASVFTALAYTSVQDQLNDVGAAARRLSAWQRANPTTDPCQ